MDKDSALQTAKEFWKEWGWDPGWVAPSVQDLADKINAGPRWDDEKP